MNDERKQVKNAKNEEKSIEKEEDVPVDVHVENLLPVIELVP